MNQHYKSRDNGIYPNGMLATSGHDLLQKVTPNMQEKLKKAKMIKVIPAMLIPVCVIMFMGGFILFGTTGSGFSPNFSILPVPIIGFFGFGACGVLTGVFSTNYAKLELIMTLINEIKGQDKTSLENLSLCSMVGKSSVIVITKKLIETGNLEDYEVIGDVGVAKTSIKASERDFTVKIKDQNITVIQNLPQRPAKCPSCGAIVTDNPSKFCAFCGTRIS